jgi:cell division protein FtsW (lipid II flippase)
MILDIFGYVFVAIVIGLVFYIFIRLLSGALDALSKNDD